MVLGAVALSFVNYWLIPDVLDGEFVRDKLDSLGLDFSFSEVAFGVFGFLLVLMMVLQTRGPAARAPAPARARPRAIGRSRSRARSYEARA